MALFKYIIYNLILNQLVSSSTDSSISSSSCYYSSGKAKRCSPEFINAAYNRPVVATNTCGKIHRF